MKMTKLVSEAVDKVLDEMEGRDPLHNLMILLGGIACMGMVTRIIIRRQRIMKNREGEKLDSMDLNAPYIPEEKEKE